MRLLALAVKVLVKGLKQTPLCTKKEKVHDGTPRDNGGQWLSMRNVLLIAATVAVMVVSFAAPAMADEVQDEESLKEEEKPLKDPGIRLCDITPTECENTDSKDPNSPVEEEKPLKDPGIRLCDITPTECDNTDDSKDDNKNNEHNNDQDKYQEYCNNPMLVYDPACDKNNEHNNDQDKYQEYCNNPMLVYDPACDKNNEHNNDQDKYQEYCNNPMLVYDPACDKNNEHNNDQDKYQEYCNNPILVYDPAGDKNNEHSQDSDDSQDEQGHNSGADPDSKDPNSPVEEEKPLKDPGIRLCDITPTECENTEEDSAQKTPVVGDPRNDSSNSDEAGQIANSSGQLATSPTTYGCPFDYEYYELWDTCRPGPKDFPLIFTAAGEMPAPDSLGGYVSLAYGLPSEAATALGFGVQVLLGHYVGDGL